MKKFDFLQLLLVMLFISLTIHATGVARSDIKHGGNQEIQNSHLAFSNTTIWENLNEELTFNDSLKITSSGNLTILNSVLTIGIYPDNSSTIRSVFDINGGELNIIGSTLTMNSTNHGISSISPSTTGKIRIINSTIQSHAGDILHIEEKIELLISGSNLVHAADDAVDIFRPQGDISLINSKFNNNTDDGLVIDNTEIGNANLEIKDSVFNNNGEDGIDIASFANGYSLINVTTNYNGKQGLDVTTGGYSLHLDRYTNIANGEEGVKIDGLGAITVNNSYFAENGQLKPADGHGFQVDFSSSTLITNSVFYGNLRDGINADDTSLTIENTYIYNTGDDGIQYDGSITERQLYFSNIEVINAGGDLLKIETHTGETYISDTYLKGGEDGLQIKYSDNRVYINNVTSIENTANGMELQEITSVTITNSTISNNDIKGMEINNVDTTTITGLKLDKSTSFGVHAFNGTELRINNSIISENQGNGIVVSNYHTVEFYNIAVTDNIGTGFGATGIITQQCNIFNLSRSIVLGNNGNGIEIKNSNSSLVFNTIEENSQNGIFVETTKNTSILNNSISSNGRNGIYIGKNSRLIINYNNITENNEYGIIAEVRSDDYLIDANYNYFGSDKGPGYSDANSISGPLNVSYVLTKDGNVVNYIPPTDEKFNFLRMIPVILLFLLINGLITYAYFLAKWKKEVKPQLVLIISTSGLPIEEYEFKKSRSDAALLSGFITAINSFGAEVVIKRDTENFSLQEIKYDKFTILMERIHTSFVAAVLEKSNILVRKTMVSFVNEMIKIYPELVPKKKSPVVPTKLPGFNELVLKYFGKYQTEEVDNTGELDE